VLLLRVVVLLLRVGRVPLPLGGQPLAV